MTFHTKLQRAKPLRIRFHKIDELIKIHNGVRYLLLFDCGWFDRTCDRSKYLICEKNDITDSINHNLARIRIDSYNSLPVEKILTFHVLILIELLIRIK